MASHTNSIFILASARDVFEYVNEPRTLPDWMVGMIETRNFRGEGEGQQYEWTFKMVGVQLRGENVVVEFVPHERAVHQSIGMISSTWTNTVRPEGDGVELTIDVQYSIPVPVLGKMAEHLTLSRNQRNLESALLNLKETLEA